MTSGSQAAFSFRHSSPWRIGRACSVLLVVCLAAIAAQGTAIPRLLLCERLNASGERTLAVEGYQQLAANGQLGVLPGLGLGTTYLDWGRLDLAAEAFDRVLRADSGNSVAWSGIGRVRLGERRWQDAADAFQRALALHTSAEARYYLALAWLRQGRFAEAKAALTQVLTDPASVSISGAAHYRLGQLLLLDQPEAAAEHLRLAFGGDGDPFSRGAELALEALDEGASAPAGQRWAILGHAQALAGEWDVAEALFERAVADPPVGKDVIAYLGYAHWRQGHGDEALATLTQAPESPLSRYFQGVIKREQGELTEAVSELRRATELDPENSDLWIELARTDIAAADYAAAEEAFLRATQAEPDDPTPHIALADFYLGHALGLPRALESARRAAATAPDSAAAQDVLGWAFLQLGDFVASEAALRRAIELDPRTPEARYHLGELLEQTGRAESAREQFRKAADLDTTGRYRDALD